MSTISVHYHLWVCLCAEFKAMKNLWEKKCTKYPWVDEWKGLWVCHVSLLDYEIPDFDKRVRYFPLYVDVLKSVMKYIFAFNHHNYIHWLTLHEDDLMKLQVVCQEFCCSKNLLLQILHWFVWCSHYSCHKKWYIQSIQLKKLTIENWFLPC